MMARQFSLLSVLLFSMALTASASADTDTYRVDPVHSMVIFRIQHLGVSYVYGRFNDPAGTITVDNADPAKTALDIQVDAAKVDTNNARRDEDLRSANFFDARKFPAIQFKSATAKKTGDTTIELSGEMTLHGVTRPINVTLTRIGSGKDPWGGYRTGYEAVFTVNRSDFGMTNMIPAVGDEVRLMINLEAVKQ